MSKAKHSLLLISNSNNELDAFTLQLSQYSDHSINHLFCSDDNLDLNNKELTTADILICFIDNSNHSWLKDLASYRPSSRPSIIIIADNIDNATLHLAMQAGARDCFTKNVSIPELSSAISKLVTENNKIHLTSHNLTSIINAKGGSGASLIACNLAHICAKASDEIALLLDMDFQFGTQSLQLDIKPAHTIIEALNDVEDIDVDALNGYIAKHNSGLHLLTTLHEQIVLPGEIKVDSLKKLLSLSSVNHNRIFIDLPRQIDPLNAMVMESSNQIVIVVQQTLAHMRDAKRLVKIMRTDLNIQDRNIFIVVNRFNKENSFTIKDIKNTLGCQNILKIPNDYERVAAAANLGVPLLDYAADSQITHSFLTLAGTLGISINDNFKHHKLTSKFLNLFRKHRG